ncbi:unnamed protein product [Anisakis simplex]|uniref:Cyclic nucleotide-binding domain-containing protein n=1 Tax=Anisakis simplex TaxID=6269 RepID=A0A0M3K036_ANISI|nr:unnamed protein product [Anisakis simplex]
MSFFKNRRWYGMFSARDLTTCILEQDEPSRVISVQMQLVTMQWLTTNLRAFHADIISQNVLEKLIKQHVRRVEFSHIPDMNDPKAVIPRTAKLYTKQEPSERFILILEGRAMVTIGQNAMTFEAGPWHCFGGELLDRLVQNAQQQCATGTSANAQQQPQQQHSSVSFSRNSLSGNSPSDNSKKQVNTFVPDFSAVVRDDCTYLEITAQTYLLAYKSTLITKGTRSRDQISHRFTVANLTSLATKTGREECCLYDVEDSDYTNYRRHQSHHLLRNNTTASFQALMI